MKDPQGAIVVADPCLLPLVSQYDGRISSPARVGGNSLLLLQLRTELEGKWRPDKFGILRRWMNISPKHWFCQKEDVQDYATRPATIMRNARKSNARKKQRARNPPNQRISLIERFSQQSPMNEESERFVDCRVDSEIPSDLDQRRIRRFLLEEEVMVLERLHEREVDLRLALLSVVSPTACVARPQFPRDLPTTTLELLEDIAALEEAVADLEEKSASLKTQIGHERERRESIAHRKTKPDGVLKCACLQSAVSEGILEPKHPRKAYVFISSASKQQPSLVTLEDHLRGNEACAQLPARCEYCGARSDRKCVSETADKRVVSSSHLPAVQELQSSEACERSSLPWKSRVRDAQQGTYVSAASDFCSKTSFLSSFDPHNRVQSTAALLQDSFSFSPARHSYSGASTSDLLGGPDGGDQGFGSSPLVSDFFTLTAPSTPENRVRPTSPGSYADLRLVQDGSSETYLKRLSRFLPTPPENSTLYNHASEEFYTPKTSASSGHLSDDSQHSSAEKPRSKVRMKLSLRAADIEGSRTLNALDMNCDLGDGTPRSLMRGLLSPTEGDILPIRRRNCGDGKTQLRDYTQTPNLLSEELVKCMISIYCHLADPSVINLNRSCYDSIPSPNSHFGHTSLSSFSSISDSSSLSFVRSPLVDLRSKDDVLGCESSPDPYKVRGRLPWADIGMYGKALEVPWMSVTKDQLGLAAQALYKFRLLVNQLAFVDPRSMSHSEKLAFWLNVYNALMMHAYLAYGVPRNDLKYFALLQKAAYNVGGHTLSAVTIEYSLLRGKSPSYRPQIGLLLALHKNKISLVEDQSKFAIDYPEPQMVFALCCGARSSPAVRVYTAAQVHKELNLALRDYARASVGMNAKGKLLVPKLLYTYAHEFVEDNSILDWICKLLPANQAGLVLECWQHRQNRPLGARKFAVLPFDFNFRYLFGPLFDPSGGILY